MVPVAHFAGRWTQRYGRKPTFLIALLAVPLRCGAILLLSAFTESQYALLATQVLDGVSAAFFDVTTFIIMADLTEGSGRFNISFAFMRAVHGIGTAVSQKLGPAIVASRCGGEAHGGCEAGYQLAFGVLGAISLVPVLVQLLFMPETKIFAFGEPRRRLCSCLCAGGAEQDYAESREEADELEMAEAYDDAPTTASWDEDGVWEEGSKGGREEEEEV